MDRKNLNFSFINYCTIYSSKGSTNLELESRACFANVFESRNNGILTNTYTIKIYTENALENANEWHRGNICLTDRGGIVNHLRTLKSLFNFKYRVKNCETYFLVTIRLRGRLIYHKFLLSWVRYLYEFPFNIFLNEAKKLRELPDFKFESIINLFNLVGMTSRMSCYGTDIHAIGKTYCMKALITNKQLKKRLTDTKNNRDTLDNLFSTIYDPIGFHTEEDTKKFGEIKVLRNARKLLYTLEYWDSDEEFENRLKLYKENYKVLKNYNEL